MIAVDLRGQLVPGPAVPNGVRCLAANNNLDVARWKDRVWLAWRTAPTHFASPEARIEVVSSAASDGSLLDASWRHETTLAVGADLRECRFVVWRGQLLLYALELGTQPLRFEPRRTHLLINGGSGFGPPQAVWESATVPWRPRVIDGRLVFFVYTGADKLYSSRPEPTEVEVWTSDDGIDWTPMRPALHHGGTEFDAARLDDGSLLGVTRLEGPQHWGSSVMCGRLDELGSWAESHDARKFDSPNVFRVGDRILMVARRHTRAGGVFDRSWSWMAPSLRTRAYQGLYSATRKRSALWELDRDHLSATWLADLPSRGDTSFGAVLARDEHTFTVLDYTSPLNGPDPSWIRGQLGPTVIVASDIDLGDS